MALSSANTASNVMPSSRKGSEISHASGQRTSASNATGQQRISNRHQATNTNKGLIARLSGGRARIMSPGAYQGQEPAMIERWRVSATTAVSAVSGRWRRVYGRFARLALEEAVAHD